MDAQVTILTVSRENAGLKPVDRPGLRLPVMLGVAALHIAAISVLSALFQAGRAPQPSAQMGIPIILVPAAPQPFASAPQILASSTSPSSILRVTATLAPLPPLMLPPGETGSMRLSHRKFRRATPAPDRDDANQALSPPSTPAASPPYPVSVPAQPPPPALSHDGLRAMAGWEARIRQAVQDAAIYPASARLLDRQGSAQVRFTYDRGSVKAATIAHSSRFGAFDDAALAAVTRAAIPDPPTELGPQDRIMLVWVQFKLLSGG